MTENSKAYNYYYYYYY